MVKFQKSVEENNVFPDKMTIDELLNKKSRFKFDGEMSLSDQLAVITHYLHNAGTKAEEKYRKDATNNIQKILECKNQGIESETSVKDCAGQYNLFSDIFNIPYPAPDKPKFTFIDLFAGMGGFRIAMQKQGGKCVYSSEWNKYAQSTYLANFGEMPFGDITRDEIKKYIPDNFDVLCAGFPCQPFSIAGVSKKNSLGRANGFLDKTQGTLFFDVADIISKKRPKAIYLENVKNLVSHDKKNTFKIICSTLEELGYNIHFEILDAKGYVPQHRERIMIIGFNKDYFNGKEEFCFPKSPKKIKNILESGILDSEVNSKYTLSDKLWNYLQEYAKKHKAKGNGFGFGLVDFNDVTRTLSARYYKDGSEILIPQGEGQNPRRLTPRECARLMGYEDKYIINAVSEVQGYRQCGNSVVVPLITAVSEKLVETLLNKK
jgi:DNA (cytosine-5)-methyltransferase 1